MDDNNNDLVSHSSVVCYHSLFLGVVLQSLMEFLRPRDVFNLLDSCRALRNHNEAWNVLLSLLGLKTIHSTSERVNRKCCRAVALFSVTVLGFNCIDCFQPLHGPNGFFAFTNVCNKCSIRRFKSGNHGYVEALVRFYLVGDQTVVSRGFAFLVFPYWLSISIEDCRDVPYIQGSSSPLDCRQSAFEYAFTLYEEKVNNVLTTS
jgi:hypothetical protein